MWDFGLWGVWVWGMRLDVWSWHGFVLDVLFMSYDYIIPGMVVIYTRGRGITIKIKIK
tara:strand:+ start:101 stop:274 length:174 start_codon:yes stop_codon:yes gene_type:complete